MENIFPDILLTREIIIFSILFIILIVTTLILINPEKRSLKIRINRNKSDKAKPNAASGNKPDKPGKIIVTDSTYEVLKREKRIK